jgi:hypothetical protein
MDGIRQATGTRELIWDLIGDYDDLSYMDYIRFASARYWLFEHAKLPDNQLDPLKDVPEERLAFALGDLNEIDLKRFAFAPHALVLKRIVLEASGEKEKVATVANQLDKQLPHHFTRYQDLIRRYPKRDWPGPRNPYLLVTKYGETSEIAVSVASRYTVGFWFGRGMVRHDHLRRISASYIRIWSTINPTIRADRILKKGIAVDPQTRLLSSPLGSGVRSSRRFRLRFTLPSFPVSNHC